MYIGLLALGFSDYLDILRDILKQSFNSPAGLNKNFVRHLRNMGIFSSGFVSHIKKVSSIYPITKQCIRRFNLYLTESKSTRVAKLNIALNKL